MTRDRVLLHGGRVFAATGGADERPVDADVLVDRDRIAAVGPAPLVADTGDVRVVDVRGACVLPGLCDAHTHISWPLDFVFDHDGVAAEEPHRHTMDVAAVLRTYVSCGYTQLIGAGVLQAEDDVVAADAVERGLVPGPRLVPSGPMVTEVGKLGADGGLMDVVADARQMRTVVARQCDSGARAIKLFISGDGIVPAYPSEDTYMNDAMLEAAVDEASRHGAFVTVHARSADSVAMAARTGVRIVHHACFVDDAALAALEARRDDIWVCPGLHYVAAMVEGAAEPWGMTPERLARSGYHHELEGLRRSLRAVHDAGVRILAGGDFGHQWTAHGTYARELQRYVELLGFTPAEALHTATRNAGPAVGLPIGTIEPGHLADLTIIDGDPTVDLGCLLRPECRWATMRGGRFVHVSADRFP